MQNKPKIYGFNNGGPHGWMEAVAIAENGKCLAQHLCTSEGYMPHDLGMNGSSTWKHENYDKEFPDGWETEFVPSDAIEKHEGLQKAFELSRQLPEVKQEEATELTS